jgi:hypothetical protein
MNNLLHHPLRVALTLAGFLCALSALMFLRGVTPPVMVMPFIPIIFQFIGSPRRYQGAIGWVMLTLLITSFFMRRIEIEAFQFENLITYGGLLFLLMASLHLFVSERVDRTIDAK